MRDAGGELLHFADRPLETGKRVVECHGKLVDFITAPADRQPAIEFGDIDPLCGIDDASDRREKTAGNDPSGGSSDEYAERHKPEGQPDEVLQRGLRRFERHSNLHDVSCTMS